jgi:tetratricopeptide (TPR) repeat protein
MRKRKVFAKFILQKTPPCLFTLFLIFAHHESIAASVNNAANNATKVEKLIVGEKKAAKEKENALIKEFYSEGERLFKEGNYEAAMDYFSRVLEIDPKHKGARSGIDRIKNRMEEKNITASPEEMAKKLLKSGQLKYNTQDYDGAMEDFQDALVLDYSNNDILEWLKRARRRKSLEEVKTEEGDLLRATEIATQKKENQEKTAMLEVEKAYLPPEKHEIKPQEVEEIVSSEEEAEDKARQELLKKLGQKMIPAISLTDADIRDVIRQLMDITGVTIVIDEGALAAAVQAGPLKITFSTVNPLPLLEVLNIALRTTGLGYKIEPDYIWISTPEKLAKEELVTKTYRLRYGVRRIRKVELKKFETKKSNTE